MRVLAIRGRNIASLADPFEVDLQREPLASASLYAIAGPTGAGKSSLLDALCLALYDQTPRSAAAPPRGGELPEVDSSSISAQDSRQLLHRGASEGYAEVDFIGVDRLAYRARWSVRRAHGKRLGRLQKVQLSLHRLPELSPVADVGNKLEALAAIRDRVGLDYRQFTRAVLLAQNEFAAFLRADQDERAQLLQTLTGSERFERLSIAAYQRSRDEAAELQLLRQQLQASPVLSDADRQALERRWQSARSRRDELREELGQIRQWQQWQQLQDKLETVLQQAADELTQAHAHEQQAAPRRRELDRLRLLGDLRQPWQRWVDLSSEDRSVRAELAQTRTDLNMARDRLQADQEQLALAEQAAQRQRDRNQAFAPELKRAEQLDEDIERQGQSIAALQQELDQRRQDLQRQAEELASGEDRCKTLHSTLAQRSAELEARAAEAWLLQAGQRWKAELDELRQVRSECAAAEDEQRQAQAALTELEQQHAALQAQHRTLQRQQQSALADQAGCEASLQDARFDRLSERLADVHRRIQAQTARAFELRLRLNLTHVRQLRSERARQAQQKLTTIEFELPAVQAAADAAEGARRQADSALRAAQLAAGHSALELRSQLDDGQPCPVCGSRDHPFADPQRLLADHDPNNGTATRHEPGVLSPLEELLTVLGQQRSAAQLDEQAQRDALAALHVQADHHRSELERLRLEQDDSLPQLQRLQDKLQADPQASALLELASTDLERELEVRAATLQQEAGELAEFEQLRSEAERALNQSRATCKLIAADLDELERRIGSAGDACGQAGQRLARAEASLSLWQLRRDQHSAGIEPWLQPLGEQASEPDLAALTARLERRAAERSQVEQQRLALQEELRELEQALPRLRGSLEAQQSSAQRATEQLHAMGETRRQQREQRAQLLGGQTVSLARADLERASLAVETGLDEARERTYASRIGLTQAQTRVEQLALRQKEIDVARERVHSELRQRWYVLQDEYAALAGIDPALAARLFSATGLDDEAEAADAALQAARTELSAGLATSQAVLDAEQTALANIEAALRLASQAHSMHQQAILEHAGEQPASPRPAAIEQAMQATGAALAMVEEAFAMASAERLRDDQSRQQASELAGAIEAKQRISDRWARLNLLIGSADGKKFRNLAQRRSLHLLLQHGNQQLRQLGSRYSLQPLKDQLNFLLVDQDLADEYRSVHSLSGGESFLVSLALALALAHLSSQQLAIESLFVDEGFGSLDEDTLNIAMQALDRLQAQGRKVGVISHLRELTERIGVQIEVQPQRAGCSRVVVRGL